MENSASRLGMGSVLTVHVDCHCRDGRLRKVIVRGLAGEDSHQVVTFQGQDLEFVSHHAVRCHGVRVVQQHRFAPPRHGWKRLAWNKKK
ncbi:uncharacterized protein CEXT_248711 [Caerostris extrusa]|uniref:Uncharacterized protein n=1 Tax=Caerostris extrusa TaxID=172846 RepID=A0AAV4RXU5_CAEEX|nr:uncharacterized protein CEXT_248711 [Caerostris extrusa]